MKKFIFGIILSVIGFIYSFTCFVYAVINPCTVNDRSGFMISLRANNVLIPFLASIFILVIGKSNKHRKNLQTAKNILDETSVCML